MELSTEPLSTVVNSNRPAAVARCQHCRPHRWNGHMITVTKVEARIFKRWGLLAKSFEQQMLMPFHRPAMAW